MPASLAAVDGISSVPKDVLVEFYGMAMRLGVDPDWLSAVISFESGWNPAVYNVLGSGAVGLIQFMPFTAKGLGTRTADLAKMSVRQQLPYVYQYFASLGCSGQMKSLADVYCAVFAPGQNCGNVRMDLDAPLYRKGTDAYAQNAGLDKGPKGFITKRDLARVAQAKLDAAASRPRIELGDIPEWTPPPAEPPILVAGVASGDSRFLPTIAAIALGYWGAKAWVERHGLPKMLRRRRATGRA